MPSSDLYKFEVVRRMRSTVDADWDIGHIDRPLEIVERRNGVAEVVDVQPHIQILWNNKNGERRIRSEVSDKSEFDRIASGAKSFYVPCRLHRKQIDFVFDREHKVVGFFGGSRAGKTEALTQRAIDSILLLGGPGKIFSWVAPAMKQTQIGVGKLRKLLPKEFVLWFPPNATTGDQSIHLSDLSTIKIYYASKQHADNLKGFSWIEAWVDEMCSIKHHENFTVMLGRLADSGGQLCFSTTFVPDSWALKHVYDPGFRRCEIPEQHKPQIVYDHITRLDNPYQDPDVTADEIIAAGGVDIPSVRREILGECVADGETMWPEFVRQRHLIEGDWRDCDGWGYTNVNQLAFGPWFPPGTAMRYIGLMDMNLWPMTMLISQMGTKKGADQNDPTKWVLFIVDEIQRKSRNEYEFAAFCAGMDSGVTAARIRQLPDDYFRCLGVVCDGTSSLPIGQNREEEVRRSSRWEVFQDLGYVMRPPDYTSKGHPCNPPRKDRITRMKKIIMDDQLRVHGTRCSHGPYALVRAIESQIRGIDGLPVKVSGMHSDRLSSATDALGYGIWRGFADRFRSPVRLAM